MADEQPPRRARRDGPRVDPMVNWQQWSRNFDTREGRTGVHRVAERVVELAREIKNDLDSGKKIYLPIFWRGAIIPHEAIVDALRRLGVDQIEKRVIRQDMMVSPEESSRSDVYAYLDSHFKPPAGSTVYYIDEAIGGSVSSSLSERLDALSRKADADLRVRLLVSHESKSFIPENKARLDALVLPSEDLTQKIKLLPVPPIAWMDQPEILGWNWGRDIVFPADQVRSLLFNAGARYADNSGHSRIFASELDKQMKKIERMFYDEYTRLKGTDPLIIRTASAYHNQYLKRDQLAHSALYAALARFFDSYARKPFLNRRPGDPSEKISWQDAYAVSKRRVESQYVDSGGLPRTKHVTSVFIGDQPVRFMPLWGRLYDPHVDHIKKGLEAPEKRADYEFLRHDPTVLIRLPGYAESPAMRYRGLLSHFVGEIIRKQKRLEKAPIRALHPFLNACLEQATQFDSRMAHFDGAQQKAKQILKIQSMLRTSVGRGRSSFHEPAIRIGLVDRALHTVRQDWNLLHPEYHRADRTTGVAALDAFEETVHAKIRALPDIRDLPDVVARELIFPYFGNHVGGLVSNPHLSPSEAVRIASVFGSGNADLASPYWRSEQSDFHPDVIRKLDRDLLAAINVRHLTVPLNLPPSESDALRRDAIQAAASHLHFWHTHLSDQDLPPSPLRQQRPGPGLASAILSRYPEFLEAASRLFLHAGGSRHASNLVNYLWTKGPRDPARHLGQIERMGRALENANQIHGAEHTQRALQTVERLLNNPDVVLPQRTSAFIANVRQLADLYARDSKATDFALEKLEANADRPTRQGRLFGQDFAEHLGGAVAAIQKIKEQGPGYSPYRAGVNAYLKEVF